MIEKRDHDLLIFSRVVLTTRKERGQDYCRRRIPALGATVQIFYPDCFCGENEMDALRIMFQHAVQGHLNISKNTHHEASARKRYSLRVDMDLMLLAFANERIIRLTV